MLRKRQLKWLQGAAVEVAGLDQHGVQWPGTGDYFEYKRSICKRKSKYVSKYPFCEATMNGQDEYGVEWLRRLARVSGRGMNGLMVICGRPAVGPGRPCCYALEVPTLVLLGKLRLELPYRALETIKWDRCGDGFQDGQANAGAAHGSAASER